MDKLKNVVRKTQGPKLHGIYSGLGQENSNGVKYDLMRAVLVLFVLSLMRPDRDQLCFLPTSISRTLSGDLGTVTCPEGAINRKANVE